ncbi:hypothetical protein INR49_001809 [Caranx melampygus]|nr:hypothetical protein INR49_001809 [Caranx melampygus]
MAETLAEAIENEQQQCRGYQTDQDHAQPQLTNHQQGSESRLGGRYRPTTLSMLSESEDGDSSGSSMMVMTRQSEERLRQHCGGATVVALINSPPTSRDSSDEPQRGLLHAKGHTELPCLAGSVARVGYRSPVAGRCPRVGLCVGDSPSLLRLTAARGRRLEQGLPWQPARSGMTGNLPVMGREQKGSINLISLGAILLWHGISYVTSCSRR